MADGAPASPEVIAAAASWPTPPSPTAARPSPTPARPTSPAVAQSRWAPQALQREEGGPGIVLLDGAAIAEHLPAIFDAATIDSRRRGETLTQQDSSPLVPHCSKKRPFESPCIQWPRNAEDNLAISVFSPMWRRPWECVWKSRWRRRRCTMASLMKNERAFRPWK